MSEDQRQEHQLIVLLKQGNERAFRQLISDHERRVYNVVLSFVRNPEVAEDLAQECFIEVFESIAGFNVESRLSTWLHRIAVHKALDHLRAGRRKKRFAILTSLFGESGELIVDPADPVHPGTQLEDRERSQVLFAAIDALPESQRVAYTLVRIDDLSVKECAETMKLSPKAVESLLSRAKSSLRRSLESYYRGSDG